MSINYKEEVDSGYDRKLIVEKLIIELLKKGIPPSIISEGSQFNIRHREMLNNLMRGYESKIDQIQDIYGTFFEIPGDGLGDSYGEITHNLKELYPMKPEEEKEMFQRKNQIQKEIEEEQAKELKRIIKEREKIINKIVKLKIKYPFLDKIIEMVAEMDELISKESLTAENMDKLFVKYNFDKRKFTTYNLIYKQYENLMIQAQDASEKIELTNQGKVVNDEIAKLTLNKNKLEEELISRNIKLVNFFIRNEYNSLLVESEELYDICLIGMANCVRNFDVSKGYRFSTYAYKVMDNEVKKNFKNLTGKSWDDYWREKKVKCLLSTASLLLGQKATLNDLYELGLIDIPYETAEKYSTPVQVLLESYIYDEFDNDKINMTFEDYNEMDKREDEYYKNTLTEENYVEEEAMLSLIKSQLYEVLTTLTDRERIVLVLRYGLDRKILTPEEREFFSEFKEEPATQKEVAKLFGVTSERIRQIEAKAFRKLRHPSRLGKIRDYI